MTSKSPSLGIISKQGGESDSGGSERRRVPRLNLTSEQFRLEQNGKIFSVSDLSSHGMALRILDTEDLNLFPVGTILKGTLNLHREKFPVNARVRHIGRDLVGCQFEQLDERVVRELRTSLDPVALGQELKPIPSSQGGVTWYHGPSGTDLLLWRGTDGQFNRFALFLLGTYAQWESGKGLETGQAESSYEQSEVRGVVRFETMLLKPDSQADRGKLNIAKTLILSSNLSQDLKKWCGRQLDTQEKVKNGS